MDRRRTTRRWRRWRRRTHATTAALLAALACFLVPAGTATVAASTPPGWGIVPVPGTGLDDVVLGTDCPDPSFCVAVGASIAGINSNHSSFTSLVERWDGSSWSLTPVPVPPGAAGAGFFAVDCTSATDCWAVGARLGVAGNNTEPLIEHWDGSSWTAAVSPALPGTGAGLLQGVACGSATDCWALGVTDDDTGAALHSVAEHWDGSTWSLVPVAPSGQTYDQLTGVTCPSASDCWAVGAAGPTQQNPNFLPIFPAAAGDQGLVEHWDGTSWSVVPSVVEDAPGGGYLTGVTCVAASDCWSTGSTTDASGDAAGVLVEHWDGTSWAPVAAPTPAGTDTGILSSVSCTDASHCWAAGSSGTFGGGGGSGFRPKGFLDVWDGATWTARPSPDTAPASLLTGISCLAGSGCWAAGSTVGTVPQKGTHADPGFRPLLERLALPPGDGVGFRLGAADGGAFGFGVAAYSGSAAGLPLAAPVVGIASTPDLRGYWLTAADGGVFAFGDAGYFGSAAGLRLAAPVVGIAATPDGAGYWEVAADGGVFAFGDAAFHGSAAGLRLAAPVVGIAATPDGAGYWEVAADGGVFAFGDAAFHGSAAGLRLAAPVVGIAATPDGAGYWEVAADGGVFAFGAAGYFGSAAGLRLAAPVVGIDATADGRGYWLATATGSVPAYGEAASLGSLDGLVLAAPVVGIG